MTIQDVSDTGTRPCERHIETPQGRVYAVDYSGDKTPIVLMHGFPDDQHEVGYPLGMGDGIADSVRARRVVAD